MAIVITNQSMLYGFTSQNRLVPQVDQSSSFVDSTDATQKSRWTINVWDSAPREAISAESTGAASALGFYGAAAVSKQTVTGAKSSNAALASLITSLANLGLVTDSTTT